jgi:hypothetical protein
VAQANRIIELVGRHTKAVLVSFVVLQWAVIAYTVRLARDASDEAYSARFEVSQAGSRSATSRIESEIEELRSDLEAVHLTVNELSTNSDDRRLQIEVYSLRDDVDRLKRDVKYLQLR